MSRRLIRLLLLLSYATGQLAALPHAHASQSSEHGQRPHVHVGWLFSILAGPGDSSADQGHSHQHEHGHHSHEHSASDPLTSIAPVGDNHDDDSAYLPGALVATKEVRGVDAPAYVYQPMAGAQESGDLIAGLYPIAILPSAPAESTREHCALYLTLRTLRI